MAISRHNPEWQRVVATAALAGVRFTSGIEDRGVPYRSKKFLVWYAELPNGARYQASSKYQAALYALQWLGAAPFLPDAASPRTAPPGPGGN